MKTQKQEWFKEIRYNTDCQNCRIETGVTNRCEYCNKRICEECVQDHEELHDLMGES